MKRRPNLVLREPVKLYDPRNEEKFNLNLAKNDTTKITPTKEIKVKPKETTSAKVEEIREVKKVQRQIVESVREKMSPRIGQIWDYFCQKAKANGELTKSFNLTRSEVMKEAGIGSANTYRDALKKFQDLELLEIELRPGVNSGSIFTLTEKGIEQID